MNGAEALGCMSDRSDVDVRERSGAVDPTPGRADLRFRRASTRTVLETARAASPLRVLMPRNHGSAAWVFLSNFGGGLVDGDCLDVRVDAGPATFALLGTQASTKVYRSPRGCAQNLVASVAEDAALVLIPDPVACFSGAFYRQSTDLAMARGASLFLLDAYTSGRSATGERWQFDGYVSRTRVSKDGERVFVDATRLDPVHGALVERMGAIDAVVSVFALGPRFVPVFAPLLACAIALPSSPRSSPIVSASRIASDAVLVRIAADRFETASRILRTSFQALAGILGDDPFARKW